MNICIFNYCCALSMLIFGSDTFANFSYEIEPYDGSQCVTVHGEPGICKKIVACQPRLADVLAGRRTGDATDRCGFDGHTEMVCCPEKLLEKIRVRSAESACQKFKSNVTSSRDDVDRTDQPRTHALAVHNVIHGVEAAPGEFPYMAVLGYVNGAGDGSNSIMYNCGGSLISSDYVLTAAHCIRNIQNRVPRWVRLGSNNFLSTNAIMIPVDRTIPHPRYRYSQNYNDIALVKLQRPVEISPWIHPICLQTTILRYSSIRSDPSVVTIGFGATSPDGDLPSDTLMKSSNLALVPVTLCNESYTDFAKIPRGIDDTMICAVDANSTRGSDACHGDSGGPLVMTIESTQTLIAVTAFGQSCGTVVPGVYTSVPAHIDWIESTVWPVKTESNESSP